LGSEDRTFTGNENVGARASCYEVSGGVCDRVAWREGQRAVLKVRGTYEEKKGGLE